MNALPQAPEAVILASASPYRRELLSRVLRHFSCLPAQVDETPLPGEQCADMVNRLAGDKAMAIADLHPGALVIGSDQALSIDGEILGKPGDRSTAFEQLRRQSGREVVFETAVTLRCKAREFASAASVPTRVRFRKLDGAMIGRYLDAEPALDCAGSFRSEGLGISLFESIHSEDPTAIVGLPLIATCALLREAGLALP